MMLQNAAHLYNPHQIICYARRRKQHNTLKPQKKVVKYIRPGKMRASQ